MNRTTFFLAIFLAVTSLIATTCDMTHIVMPKKAAEGKKSNPEISQEELEKTGHFLKLTYMPPHTQSANVSFAHVANAASTIARLNQNSPVHIFSGDANTCTVYIPLVYNDDSEFTETGSFYVAFAVHVDAVTSYTVDLSDKILVPFTDGRGELDIRTLPVSGPGYAAPDLTESEREELERTGHFLKLTYMPLNTQSTNVATTQVANSTTFIAGLNKNQGVRIFRDTDFAAVYIPLVYFDNSEFTENGQFYVTFAIHVDAVTSYIVTITDKILIPFADGRGELDIRILPYGGIIAADRRYLTIYNLPMYLLPQNVANVFINNRYGPVAQCQDYALVGVSTFGGRSTVSIPLSFVNSSNLVFSGTGSFYVAFDINIDALTHYTVTADDHVLAYFLDGNGYLDINDLPGVMAAEHRYLTITSLPPNLLPQNVSNVTIRDQAGPVAQCEDYALVEVSVSDGNASARIPLFYSNPRSLFTGTGNFVITFNIIIDANTSYIVTSQNNIQVAFTNGSGSFDVSNIPVGPPPDRRYFTITNLPANLLAQNVTNVFIRNQAGTVARCEDYNLLEIAVSGGAASVRIPLVFNSSQAMFTGTGNYVVTFNINIDAKTDEYGKFLGYISYIVAATDYVLVTFTNGNGTLDITKIPEKPMSYLTIKGLPINTTKQQISEVNIYNAAGIVATCKDYNNIVIKQEGSNITAIIPLSYTAINDYFQDTGRFAITAHIHIDVETYYLIDRNWDIVLNFDKGSAVFDLKETFGYFNAALVNAALSDGSKPVIQSGSAFDVNGYRVNISGNLAVPAEAPAGYSGILYLYAYRDGDSVFYEFSPSAPGYNPIKNGYYIGNKRALWYMIYLADGTWMFKTYITEPWPQFAVHNMDGDIAAYMCNEKPVVYYLPGDGNPPPNDFSLPPGVYIAWVFGAGGGTGHGGGPGGTGGSVCDLFTLNSAAAFTAFAGSSGGNGGAPESSGSVTYHLNKYSYTVSISPSSVFDGTITATSTSALAFNLADVTGCGGGGGGGGGSGSYLYSASGYFMCAGGGGGSSGQSHFSPGGAGGAGGSIGPGAGGGAAGFVAQVWNNTPQFFLTGGHGGAGGGHGGGAGGLRTGATSDPHGASAPASPGMTSFVNAAFPGGAGAGSHEESSFSITPLSSYVTPLNQQFRSSGSSSAAPLVSVTGGATTSTARTFATNGTNSFSFSNSGNGGNTPAAELSAFYYTNAANGIGASAPALGGTVIGGSISTNIFTPTGLPASYTYSFTYTNDLHYDNEPVVAGNPGGDGGNNRNGHKGGGKPAGSAGVVQIFKIY